MSLGWAHRSAERAHEGLHAVIEKLEFALPIDDGFRLPDQLIETLLGDRADTLLVDVDAMTGTGRLAIDEDAKSHGCAWCGRPHDEMQVAGVKAIRNSAARI